MTEIYLTISLSTRNEDDTPQKRHVYLKNKNYKRMGF